MYASMKDGLVEQMAEISNCSAALRFCSETERGWAWGADRRLLRNSRVRGMGWAWDAQQGNIHSPSINK